MVSKRFLAAGGVAVLACVAVVTAANKWGNYHWERAKNPVELTLGNNLADYWTAPNSLSGGDNGHFALAIADWNVSSVLSLTEVAGNAKGNCGAKDGKIEVCSKTYGYNGWGYCQMLCMRHDQAASFRTPSTKGTPSMTSAIS